MKNTPELFIAAPPGFSGMSKPLDRVTVHDLLKVMAQIRLVAHVDQPQRDAMLTKLISKTNDAADKQVYQFLAEGKIDTLQDFLLARASLPPTQTLAEILSNLTFDHYTKIDRTHLLTNLLFVHLNGNLTIFELGTVMQRYSLMLLLRKLTTFNYKDHAMRQQMAAGITVQQTSLLVGEKISPDLLGHCGFFGKASCERLEQSKFAASQYHILDEVVLFKMNKQQPERSRRFMEDFDTLSAGLNVSHGEQHIMIPLHMQMQIYTQTKDNTIGYMLPLPIIGCFDFSIMEQYECAVVDGVSFRPVTLPSYLDPDLKALFYGAKPAKDIGDVQYGAYDASATKPGFKDMRAMHTGVLRQLMGF